jgi:hypothetical protein
MKLILWPFTRANEILISIILRTSMSIHVQVEKAFDQADPNQRSHNGEANN